MIVPSTPYYEEYYDKDVEEPTDHPMEMNMMFELEDTPPSPDLTDLLEYKEREWPEQKSRSNTSKEKEAKDQSARGGRSVLTK
jgi:hypothetical protein